nr:MAG TPA: hypothetical protein [Caudoviricetes sp.]
MLDTSYFLLFTLFPISPKLSLQALPSRVK